ncbi:MAG: DUF2726 domain-containing protein [Polaromonas sp.]|nr:DUF2726 domain-containing protein [Polaromonas sp.]
MKFLIFGMLVLIVLFVVVAVLKKKQGGGDAASATRDLRRKTPLTEREQGMFFRLCATFPEHVVLSQVAFSALLVSKQQATRNGYNRKFADFVLCTKSFEVVAVIELDDSSHKGRGAADGDRDAWLTAAGYRVVRYANTPDTGKLLTDLLGAPPACPSRADRIE